MGTEAVESLDSRLPTRGTGSAVSMRKEFTPNTTYFILEELLLADVDIPQTLLLYVWSIMGSFVDQAPHDGSFAGFWEIRFVTPASI
jgi:hypothetical protein